MKKLLFILLLALSFQSCQSLSNLIRNKKDCAKACDGILVVRYEQELQFRQAELSIFDLDLNEIFTQSEVQPFSQIEVNQETIPEGNYLWVLKIDSLRVAKGVWRKY